MQTGPKGLVDVLDSLLLHGTMTRGMEQSIIAAVQNLDPGTMVRNVIYLIATSPQYRVMQ